eukprot:scaffold12959_cov116-Isochrysis_galbana.AAC.13
MHIRVNALRQTKKEDAVDVLEVEPPRPMFRRDEEWQLRLTPPCNKSFSERKSRLQHAGQHALLTNNCITHAVCCSCTGQRDTKGLGQCHRICKSRLLQFSHLLGHAAAIWDD